MAAHLPKSSRPSTWARWSAIISNWTEAPHRWWRPCRSWAAPLRPARKFLCRGTRPTCGRSRKGTTEEAKMKRRSFVAGAAAGVSTFGILSSGARAQSKEIRMIESGGLSGDSIQKGYIEPLARKSGIKVIRESPSSLGRLQALVAAGQKDTVLFELGSGVMVQATKLGLIEKIDWAAVDPAPMYPEA